MESFELEKWEEKRKSTIRVYVLECLLLGMESSVIYMTLWIYITTLIKTDHPEEFYSLISASYMFSAIVSSMFIGRWVDKTRNIRLTFFICNCFVIIGNLIYIIHQSPWYLVLGRIVSGVGSPMRSVVSGEIARCFPPDEQTRKFSTIGLAFAMGFVVGPAINLFFKDVSIKFLIFHINFANVPGLYMAVLFFIAQAFVLFAMHDLSKEYDIKAIKRHQEQEVTDKFFEAEDSLGSVNEETPLLQNKSEQTKITSILLQNIKNFEVAFIFLLSFAIYFWMEAFEMWEPMMAIDILKMSITQFNYIMFGSGLVSTIVYALFITKQISDKALFKWGLVCVVALAAMEAIFASMKIFQTSFIVNILLWVIYITLYAILVLFEEVFLMGVFAKMNASSVQTFNESLRESCANLGGLVALSTSAILFKYVEYICLGGIVFSIFVFLVLLVRRKKFEYPELTIR